ncbi:MAG: D-alanyl-D-alanine carboxypeptidase [Deltaproteobacteria bacterium]|nr:D-alanyl-D-alanine carboxypeptidase [Deltaproteobacteria bacterium]
MRARCSLMVLALVLISVTDASAAIKKNHSAGIAGKHAARRLVSSSISRTPYIGAIVVDAVNGRVLFNDNADSSGYPASVTKLMDLLIILEKVREGTLAVTDKVTVTAEAVKVGGSQAYLREHETFSLEELLYALMVKSANDVAVALAVHVAGSPEAFVQLMNRKAQQLGMAATHFHSVHGLSPGRGLPRDVSTARDLSLLAAAVLKYPDALRYTSTKRHAFRNGTVTMRNHNRLLGVVEGCDGLKTGYFAEAGYSIAATAQRQDERIIVVVLGSRSLQMRDIKTRELLAKGFREAERQPVMISTKGIPPFSLLVSKQVITGPLAAHRGSVN